MGNRHEIVWHLRGSVLETIFNIGKKDRPYWQVILQLENGFACVYVRREDLRKTAEELQEGDLVEASGTIKPQRDQTKATRPMFLDPVEQIVKIARPNE